MKINKSAIFAILAIALSTFTATAQTSGYSGSRTQTDPFSITYTGTIDGQYIDDDMVPVQMCSADSQLIWAEFSASLYKDAVYANQQVAKGRTVEVTMVYTRTWFSKGSLYRDYFKIIKIKVIVKLAPAVKQQPRAIPAAPKQKQISSTRQGTRGISTTGGYTPQTTTCYPVYQPCPCNGVTINGSIHAPVTITTSGGTTTTLPGNGNGGGTSPTIPQQGNRTSDKRIPNVTFN